MRRLLVGLAVFSSLALAGLLVVGERDPALYALARCWRDPPRLAIPVAGVRWTALSDGWGEPRSDGRRHEGIDIFARRGTPVVAAAAGEVLRIGDNRLGGHCVWVAGAGARIYYYAHLDHFEPTLSVGDTVAPGAVLGYVGTSGNAKGTPPHLHFGVYPLARGFRAVDPFPLLQPR